MKKIKDVMKENVLLVITDSEILFKDGMNLQEFLFGWISTILGVVFVPIAYLIDVMRLRK